MLRAGPGEERALPQLCARTFALGVSVAEEGLHGGTNDEPA
jgi:hypothetical protein